LAAPKESPTPLLVLRPCPEPGTILLAISGVVARSGISRLCERVRALLNEEDGDVVVCDVSALVDPDAVAVDALARLQLTARRQGRRIWLHRACTRLQELLTQMGLSDVVPLAPRSWIEARGQAEEREPAGSIEEEGDPGDPIA
jgi:ABC-type transporter Mla MlaB component